MRLETFPITARSLERDYYINGDNFERSYKEVLSGYRDWDKEDSNHGDGWVVRPDNTGTSLSIDETCLSTGEVYTLLSNKAAHGGKGCLVAMVRGTKSGAVSAGIKNIPEGMRMKVTEVTMDFSESMRQIVKECFPKAIITLDRFHHQQFCLEAEQELRISHRREVMTKDANDRLKFRLRMKDAAEKGETLTDKDGNAIRSNAAWHPERLSNGETRAEMLVRSRCLLMMSPDKWSEEQRERSEILFEEYPDIKTAFSLTHSLRMIFSQRCDKETARKSLQAWYDKVARFGNNSFNNIAAAMFDREDDILNYFLNHSTNASAESLNAKIKHFRSQLRGIVDKDFFIFRLVKIFG